MLLFYFCTHFSVVHRKSLFMCCSLLIQYIYQALCQCLPLCIECTFFKFSFVLLFCFLILFSLFCLPAFVQFYLNKSVQKNRNRIKIILKTKESIENEWRWNFLQGKITSTAFSHEIFVIIYLFCYYWRILDVTIYWKYSIERINFKIQLYKNT